MVAPAGEARRVITPLSVGHETAGQISPRRGRTRAAYKAAGTTLPIDDRKIRAVHRQRGSKIITAQNGKTKTLLNLKTNPISPFVWLLGFIENRPRLVRLAANVTVVSFIVEMIVIIGQAGRGTTSHFNLTTPINSFLWFTMGAFIVLVWTMNLLLAIMLLRQRMPDQAFAWSLRLGVLISSIGIGAAFFMVTPTPEQAAAIASGYGPHIVGAHSVGVADGGPGLPIFGWSTVGGDLRAAHFVGLHALQILPFLGWLLTRRKSVFALLAANDRLTLVCTGGLGYLGMVLLLTWQALRGQSVLNPDAKTIAAAGVLAASVATSILITAARVFIRNRKTRVLASAI